MILRFHFILHALALACLWAGMVRAEEQTNSLLTGLPSTTIGGFVQSSIGEDGTVVIDVPIVDASSRGWYTSSRHENGNDNYLVGKEQWAVYRNFFIFQIPVFPDGRRIRHAQLLLYNPSAATSFLTDGFRSADKFEQYQLFPLDRTSPAALRASCDDASVAMPIFKDLRDGVPLSDPVQISAKDNGSMIVVPLNGRGVRMLNHHAGQEIALGGSLVSLSDDASTVEYLFAATSVYDAPLAATFLRLKLGPARP